MNFIKLTNPVDLSAFYLNSIYIITFYKVNEETVIKVLVGDVKETFRAKESPEEISNLLSL